MTNLRRLLPSLRGLVVFEAAGRLSSFTRAGNELGMTQSAVSYSIKLLENDLGCRLFEREHRTVALTDAGANLYVDVSQSLSQIALGVEAIRNHPVDEAVTLSVSTAFATLWLAPRLQQMRTDLPDIELRLHTADRDLDLIAEGIPLGIRSGRPKDWPGYDCERFDVEEILAVASPQYLKTHGVPDEPRDLLDHHLAHLEEPYRYAATWSDWLTSAGVGGVKSIRGTRANEYVAVLHMALDGDAITLGWRHLVQMYLKNGRLRQVTTHSFKTGDGYYLIWPKQNALSENCCKVRDWILADRERGEALTSVWGQES